jgi:AcrR family transcriptional regulator
VADDTPAGLPGNVAAAWGMREHRGRGPKRGLSLEQVVAAGLAVASSDGLAAVSMSRIAAELGVGTMSLYRYVDSKRELLDLMVDAGLGPPPLLDPDAAWRDGLSGWAWAQLAAFRRQLWVVQVPLAGPPATPNVLSWIEQALRYLRGLGLQPDQKMFSILLIASFVRTEATIEAQIDAAVRASGQTDQETMAGYGRLLSVLLDERRFPELTAMLASGVIDKADHWDDGFAFGLERILDGIDGLIRSG